MLFEHLLGDLRSVLFPDSAEPALPVMDGPLTPNNKLEQAAPLGDPIPACDDIAAAGDGSLYVSGGRQILRLSGESWRERAVAAEFDSAVGPLAWSADGHFYAGLGGAGVVKLKDGREVARLSSVDGRPLQCVTAIAPLPDGRIAIAEGSAHNPPEQWCRDLLERRASGRILAAKPDLSSAAVLRDNLAWPYGLLATPDGKELWFSESWRHRLQALPLAAPAAAPRTVLRNLPGYPARLSPAAAGGAWLGVFAVRTHLIELVLRETRYRRDMLATVDPRYWIAPSLRATGHYLEPLQGGAIKKLGLTKPWAPPRSYGLVLRLSPEGECLASLHSRVGGAHHGVTAARECGGRLLIACKGGECLLTVEPEAAA